jgi:hypothetical protein
MAFDQYHEPAHELTGEIRTKARMLASIVEEAEAINGYEQRISVEKDPDAKTIRRTRSRKSLNILEWTSSSCFVKCPSGGSRWKPACLNKVIFLSWVKKENKERSSYGVFSTSGCCSLPK